MSGRKQPKYSKHINVVLSYSKHISVVLSPTKVELEFTEPVHSRRKEFSLSPA